MHRLVVFVAALLLVGPVWASEPGEPLDCSDMVFSEPGLSCTVVVPFPCGDHPACEIASGGELDGSPRVVDNEGNIYWVRRESHVRQVVCNSILQWFGQIQVVKFDGATTNVIAYIDDRCGVPGQAEWTEHPRSINSWPEPSATGLLFFDDKAGHLYVPLRFGCVKQGSPPFCYGNRYTHPWIARIEGFTTTFEILHSYDDRYFLVVPLNYIGEGSYGEGEGGAQRPVGTPACLPTQSVSPCP
jgi:hypothetical protein